MHLNLFSFKKNLIIFCYLIFSPQGVSQLRLGSPALPGPGPAADAGALLLLPGRGGRGGDLQAEGGLQDKLHGLSGQVRGETLLNFKKIVYMKQ